MTVQIRSTRVCKWLTCKCAWAQRAGGRKMKCFCTLHGARAIEMANLNCLKRERRKYRTEYRHIYPGQQNAKSKTPHNFVLGTFAEGNYLLPWRPNCEASDLLPDLPTLSQVRFPNIIIIITIVIGTTTIMPNLPEASFPNSVAIGTDCLILPPPTIYIFGSQKLSPAKVVEKTGQIMSLPFHCLERKTCQSKAYKNQSLNFENPNLLGKTCQKGGKIYIAT